MPLKQAVWPFRAEGLSSLPPAATATLDVVPVLKRLDSFMRAHFGRRFLHYGLVSAIGVVMTQSILAGLHGGLGARAWLANIVAVGLTTPVSYRLNRAWVWGKRGKSHLTKEVIPFWGFSAAGLLLSTALVALVSWSQHVPRGVKPTSTQTLEVNVANLCGFGVLWLLQFFVLDKVSFKHRHLDRLPVAAGANGSSARHGASDLAPPPEQRRVGVDRALGEVHHEPAGDSLIPVQQRIR